MSVYFNNRRNWYEYFFRLQKKPYTKAGFKTMKEARAAEAEKKKDLKSPKKQESTDMAFLTLLNHRLDHLEAYRTKSHYKDNVYMAKKWIKLWKDKTALNVSTEEIRKHLIDLKNKVSAHTANKELKSIRALWNFGIKQRWFTMNPADGIEFFPVDKQPRYVPSQEDIIRVIMASEGEIQDYLWTIALTMGRMSEINSLEWEDVDFNLKTVRLFTRKTKGGDRVSRMIPMCNTLVGILKRRLKKNNTPWVFYHTYFSRSAGEWVTGPYRGRNRIMKTLCKKAGVKYFRFHPLRHFGASMLVKEGVDSKTIQTLLGHANFKTTEIYLHQIRGVEKEAMDRLDSVFFGRQNVVVFKKRKTKAQD